MHEDEERAFVRVISNLCTSLTRETAAALQTSQGLFHNIYMEQKAMTLDLSKLTTIVHDLRAERDSLRAQVANLQTAATTATADDDAADQKEVDALAASLAEPSPVPGVGVVTAPPPPVPAAPAPVSGDPQPVPADPVASPATPANPV